MYTVVGYDKDNDVYAVCGRYSDEYTAFNEARRFSDMVNRGELHTANGEPVDWMEVYLNWNEPNEKRVVVV